MYEDYSFSIFLATLVILKNDYYRYPSKYAGGVYYGFDLHFPSD